MSQKILISNKLNKDERSLTNISINNNKYYLTEKDWLDLIRQLQSNRPDLFDEWIKDTLDPYIHEIDYLKEENQELSDENDSLRYELEEYETDN